MARTLPLFPLPLVLFPGTRLPLHIFEPRYKQMLSDCLAGDRTFGIVFCPQGSEERALPTGHVGCLAIIEEARLLPDGRSNIVVSGGERFTLDRFVATPAPYHVAEVGTVADTEESPELLADLATLVRKHFDRAGAAARAIADDRAPLPTLDVEPPLLAFRVAAFIEMEPASRQRLLASRSAAGRLRELADLLGAAVEPLERRASLHRRAKQNGRGAGHAGPLP